MPKHHQTNSIYCLLCTLYTCIVLVVWILLAYTDHTHTHTIYRYNLWWAWLFDLYSSSNQVNRRQTTLVYHITATQYSAKSFRHPIHFGGWWRVMGSCKCEINDLFGYCSETETRRRGGKNKQAFVHEKKREGGRERPRPRVPWSYKTRKTNENSGVCGCARS